MGLTNSGLNSADLMTLLSELKDPYVKYVGQYT